MSFQRTISPVLPLAILTAVTLALSACGSPRNDGPAKNDDVLVLKLQPLSFLGHRAYPGDEIALKVLALRSAGDSIDSEEDLVVAAGEVVAWTLVGNSGDASMGDSQASAQVLTDETGVASITLNVGTSQSISYQLQAELVGAPPVLFSIQTRLDTRELQIIGGSPTDGVVSRSERLRVRLMRPASGSTPASPVVGEIIQVQLLTADSSGAYIQGATGDTFELTTDFGGIATFNFYTGDVAGLTHSLEFCGAASCAGVSAKTLELIVGARDNGVGCQYFTDCETGYVCDSGVCRPAGSYCDGAQDCPTGFICASDRKCAEDEGGANCSDNSDCPDGYICGNAGQCIPEGGCLTQADCPDGWACNPVSGACIPPSDESALDVRGRWLSPYHFDISDTLPG